jgi:hypothetical protein
MPVSLEGAMRSVRVDDSSRTVRGPVHAGARLAYTVRSDVERPADTVLARDESTDYPDFVRRFDLQLPRGFDPRVATLAQEIVGDAATPFEKVRRVETHLKERYAYTLELRRSDTSIDPVADFLLNTRAGHCEYFASGMVLLLRSVGVPCRLVNGFQMGEYNDIAGAYIVRQADAHSWVEVFFPATNRWVEFDPTPPSGFNQYGQASLADRLRHTAEAAQMFWIQYVVGLDDTEQVSMMRSAQSRFSRIRAWVTARKNAWRDWGYMLAQKAVNSGRVSRERVMAVLGVVLGLGALAFVAFVLHGRGWALGGFVLPMWKLRRLRRGGQDSQRTAVLFYEQMTALLAPHGLARERHVTPREFADATGFDEVRVITEHYNRTRFGGSLDERAEREVASALAGLAARLRRGRARAKA